MSTPSDPAGSPTVTDQGWRGLYIAGGLAALIAVVFFRRNFGTELVTFRGFGIIDVPATHPGSALDWFMLLQEDRLLGLAMFDVVDLVNYGLVALVFLALYGFLRRAGRGAMTAATAFGLVGAAVYFASNQAFSMLTLSDRYAAATTDALRTIFLAAGEALLAIHNPGAPQQGTGLYISLFLVLLAGLIISVVMLRSSVFGRATAYVGILANALGLGHFVALAIAPDPVFLALPSVLSAPFRMIWYVLIAVTLLRLGSGRLPERGGQDDR